MGNREAVMKQKMGCRAQIRDSMRILDIRSPDISQWYIRNGDLTPNRAMGLFANLVLSVKSHTVGSFDGCGS
jgi:hypothetical protein